MSDQTDRKTSRQVVFFATGSIAGVCSALADFSFDRTSSAVRGAPARPVAALYKGMLPHIIKPGIRFWGFDLAKSSLLPDTLPVSVKGGLSGAFGGFLEMASTNIYSSMAGKAPTITSATRTTLLHSCKLFLCFGSYTYLANTYSETLPPRPFSYCLFLGSLAGALGTTLITPIELYSGAQTPLRINQILRTAISRAPRGAVGVGTVIAVQVTSSAWILNSL